MDRKKIDIKLENKFDIFDEKNNVLEISEISIFEPTFKSKYIIADLTAQINKIILKSMFEISKNQNDNVNKNIEEIEKNDTESIVSKKSTLNLFLSSEMNSDFIKNFNNFLSSQSNSEKDFLIKFNNDIIAKNQNIEMLGLFDNKKIIIEYIANFFQLAF